jgi:prepilin-type N-terminal cleavage/methylation domain-containing protein
MKILNIKFKAFTLAEILITLLIIGVVTSLVIPNIINDTQDSEFKTAFKKQYGIFDNIIRQLLIENQDLSGICTDYDSTCFASLLKPSLSIFKSCTAGTSAGNCFHRYQTIKNLNGIFLNSVTAGNSPIYSNGNAGFILNDGSLVAIYYRYSTPDCDLDCYLGTTLGGNSVAGITVDVNGWKAPNTLGKDIFSIIVLRNKILPGGTGCLPCTSSSSMYAGFGCAAKILKGQDY